MIETLISVTFGALLVFLTNSLSEKKRWKRELKLELLKDKRKAIAQALRWLDPMKNAVGTINSISMAYIRGNINREVFLDRWPNLIIGTLSKLDVSHGLLPLLPEETYSKGVEISHIIEWELIRTAVIAVGEAFSHPNPKVVEQGKVEYIQLNDKLNELNQKLRAFKDELRSQFLSTYSIPWAKSKIS